MDATSHKPAAVVPSLAPVPLQRPVQQLVSRWYSFVLGRIASTPGPVAHPARRWLRGVAAALIGVTVVTIIIGQVLAHVHVENISLLYLIAVIWLAVAYGRGATIVASVLAFLAYDFFFIPPEHLFTVDDPTEWISLFALLITGLVVGQLTSEVRRRERIAIVSEQRMAMLFALVEEIATQTDPDRLLHALTQHTVDTFAPTGVQACAVFLSNETGNLSPRAIVHDPTAEATVVQMDLPEHLACATAAFHEGVITALVPSALHNKHAAAYPTYFVPLISRSQSVGVMSVSGLPGIALLLGQQLAEPGLTEEQEIFATQRADLFEAFCDQIALAIDRADLQRVAVHTAALQESDRLKTALLGSVTHDLRTPIAAIEAAASSLQQPDVTWSNDDGQELLTMITTSADRLAHMVDNLLVLSRLESGTPLPEKQPYPIGDAIAAALDQLEAAGRLSGHPVRIDAADEMLEAQMDHSAIERVLINLVENAAKYSPPGSEIRIGTRALPTQHLIEVRVSDRGIGIPRDQLSHVFDPFTRLEQSVPWSPTRPPQGNGLGLAICAGIIREHEGKIWAESVPGKGTTMIFTLPLAAATVTLARPEQAS